MKEVIIIGYGISIYLLQRTFQKKDAIGKVFYSFLFLGLSSTICLQSLVFIPVLWFIMAKYLGSMSIRAFSASILGILAPYWFITPIYMLMGKTDLLLTHASSIVTTLQIPDYTQLDIYGVLFYGIALLLNIIFGIYYFYTDNGENQQLKTKVEAFNTLFYFSALLPILQPQLLPCFIGMMLVSESFVIGVAIKRLWRI